MRLRMFQIVQRAQTGDRVSRAYDIFLVIVAFVSIVPMFFHVGYLSETTHFVINTLDLVSVYILAFDYILRWITHDLKEGHPYSWKSFVRYPFTLPAIIDLLGILPSLNVLPAGFTFLRVLRVFRLFRYSRHLSIIANVFYQERKTLGLILLIAAMYTFITSLIMFTFEDETFGSFLDALYWGTITLTTIGFGDIYPLTDAGRVITSVSALVGIFVLALPAGIMTGSFLKQLQIRREDGERYFSESFIGDFNLKYFLFTPAMIKAFFARNPKVRLYLAAISAGVAIDIIFYLASVAGLGLPVWLDTAGTALVACAIDPAAGIIVGYVNNLFLAIYTGNAGNLLYLAQSVVVALAYGILLPLDENGGRPRRHVVKALLLVIVVQAVISFGLSILLQKDTLDTVFMQTYQSTLLGWGLPFYGATFGALLIDRVFDSLAVFFIVSGFCRIMKNPRYNPRRWLVEHGVTLREDFSACTCDKAHGVGTDGISCEEIGIPLTMKIEGAARVLESRIQESEDADEMQRYQAGVNALRILQNADVRDEREYGRLFDALTFGNISPYKHSDATRAQTGGLGAQSSKPDPSPDTPDATADAPDATAG